MALYDSVTRADLPLHYKYPAMEIYAKHILGLHVTPPKEPSKGYRAKPQFFKLPDGTTEYFTERQLNLATHMAAGVPLDDAYVMSGYKVLSHLKHVEAKKMDVRKHILSKAGRVFVPSVMALSNAIQTNTIDKLVVDATWLLNAQINLYLKAEAIGQLATAARVLNDIASHIDVDAKATNKLSIDDSVDYAAVLNKATKRIAKPRLVIPDEPKTIEFAGEVISLDDGQITKRR